VYIQYEMLNRHDPFLARCVCGTSNRPLHGPGGPRARPKILLNKTGRAGPGLKKSQCIIMDAYFFIAFFVSFS